MYRAVKLSGRWVAIEKDVDLFDISDIDTKDELENIGDFIITGDVVVLGDSLEDIADALEIDVDDIKVVS